MVLNKLEDPDILDESNLTIDRVLQYASFLKYYSSYIMGRSIGKEGSREEAEELFMYIQKAEAKSKKAEEEVQKKEKL